MGTSARKQRSPSRSDLEVASRIAAPLEGWFAQAGSRFEWRSWRDAYRVTVTEILLQRTRATVVEAFLPGFLAKYPTWSALRDATIDTLERELHPLGLEARRANLLVTLAREELSLGTAWSPRRASLGQYAARAVEVTLWAARSALVDSNFVRVVTRLFAPPWMSDYRFDRRLQGIAQQVVNSAEDPRSVNWALLDLGRTVCLPRIPRCDQCPLRPYCRYAAAH
jgi:A/G-specific adenine glycosylase